MTEETLFELTVNTPEAERAALLDRECVGNSELRRRVEALLRAHAEPEAMLTSAFRESAVKTNPSAHGTVVVGRYKLLELIGQGGMGEVWVAEQTEPVKRKVALKLIKAGMDSRSVLARFDAERQALALMDHPNIAKVLDGGLTDTGRPFFVMEYVKGVPITEYCDATRLSVDDRLQLFIQVCSAVQHAHQKGIIHRDLKPSNILVAPYDDKPVPKVIDFGLAKAIHQSLTDKTLHTAHESVLGTPLYMSPEQAQLNNLDIDTRSDVYSLGVLLYELLTGTTPLEKKRFREAAWDEIRRLIREEEPPRPSTRLSSADTLPNLAARRHIDPTSLTRLVRGDLDWIVMKALEKDRTRRYDTANSFATDVERYLAGEPVHAHPPSAGYRLRKFVRKHRASLTTAAALAGLLLLGAGVSAWQAVRAGRAEAAALAERDAKEQAREAEAAERQRAEESAAATRAVSDFLVNDLLAQGREADVKLRTVLDRAAAQVGARFTGQPAVEAAVRSALGTTYFYLGLNREALPHVERAYELYRTVPPPDDDPTLGQLTIMLIGLYGAHGNQDAAIKLNSEWEERIRRLAPSSLKLSPGMRTNDLIQALKRQEASPFRDSMLKLLEPMAIHPDSQMVELMRKAAEVRGLIAARRFPEAEKLLVEVIDAFRARAGEPATLLLQFRLGTVYRMEGKYAEAEVTVRRALDQLRRTTDPNSPRLVDPLLELAYILIAQKNFAAAEPCLRQALTIQESEAPNSVARFELLSLLGECLVGMQKYAEAEPLLLSGYEGLRTKGLKPKELNLGASPMQNVPDSVRRLVDLYTAWGKPDEAAKWKKVLKEAQKAAEEKPAKL